MAKKTKDKRTNNGSHLRHLEPRKVIYLLIDANKPLLIKKTNQTCSLVRNQREGFSFNPCTFKPLNKNIYENQSNEMHLL